MAQSVAGIECRFFLGRREALEREEDAIPLWVNDDDDHLPEKVLAFFRYALEYYDFDWLFKCDDNTYVALDRLAELADDQYDLIGDSSLKAKGAPAEERDIFFPEAWWKTSSPIPIFHLPERKILFLANWSSGWGQGRLPAIA